MLLGAASASAPSPTSCLGGHDAPCGKQLCTLNAVIPMPRSSPMSYQRPYAGAQEKARWERFNSMAFPDLAWWATWPGECHCCCAPALITPQGPDTVSSSHMALEGSRMGPEGRKAAPAAAEPPCLRPRAGSPGPGRQPWQNSGWHSNHGGCHRRCPPWGQQGSQLGQEGRGFV